MAVPLLMVGAVPFNPPSDSLAGRRQRRNMNIGENIDTEQMILDMVTEAAEAVQFVLGPRHRMRSNSTSSRRYTVNSAQVKMTAPPNTPNNKISFTYPNIVINGTAVSDNDADESSCDENGEQEVTNNRPATSTRKRRRLTSFSGTKSELRRVPHKKIATTETVDTDTTEATHLDTADTNHDTVDTAYTVGTDHDTVDAATATLAAPSTSHRSLNKHLSLLSNIQKKSELTPEEKWIQLGKELRNIADKFERGQQLNKGVSKYKDMAEIEVLRDNIQSIMPKGVWSAIISFVFWKIFNKFT